MIRTVITTAAAGVATAASLMTLTLYTTNRDSRQQDINVAVCKSVVKLDGAITDSLQRSLAALPKIQYYKEHPDELRNQQRQIKSTLKEFQPPPECRNQGGTS